VAGEKRPFSRRLPNVDDRLPKRPEARKGKSMADLGAEGLKQLRLDARRGAQVQRMQQMVLAAGIAALCVIAVAGVFLAQVM